MQTPDSTCSRSSLPDRVVTQALPILCLWASLLLFSFVHAPFPGVNEPHYLAKARHYWQPDWCRRDLFLESSNPHQFFYQTIGMLTRVMPISTAAIIGRFIAYLFLAVAWQRLCDTVTKDRWSGLVAAWLFLLMQSIGSLSGEWLIGGVESKVIAYGCIFFALSRVVDGLWIRAATWAGVATAFHPLVGLWSVLAAGLVPVFEWAVCRRERSSGLSQHRASLRTVFASITLFISIAWIGIVPALQSVRGTNPEESFAASYIQVFYRLPHHLYPKVFKLGGLAGYASLSGLLIALARFAPRDERLQFLRRFTVASSLFTLAGLVIGWGPPPDRQASLLSSFEWNADWFSLQLALLRMTALKFYPFRLFDLMLPLLAAITFASLLSRRWILSTRVSNRLRIGLPLAGYALAVVLSVGTGSLNRLPESQRGGWLDVCRWVNENAPVDALFVTPNEGFAFKWYADRAEYVALKDCPQDPHGLVEWNNRLRFIRQWGKDWFVKGEYSAEAMRVLRDHTQADFLIAGPRDHMQAPVVYSNGIYKVLKLKE